MLTPEYQQNYRLDKDEISVTALKSAYENGRFLFIRKFSIDIGTKDMSVLVTPFGFTDKFGSQKQVCTLNKNAAELAKELYGGNQGIKLKITPVDAAHLNDSWFRGNLSKIEGISTNPAYRGSNKAGATTTCSAEINQAQGKIYGLEASPDEVERVSELLLYDVTNKYSDLILNKMQKQGESGEMIIRDIERHYVGAVYEAGSADNLFFSYPKKPELYLEVDQKGVLAIHRSGAAKTFDKLKDLLDKNQDYCNKIDYELERCNKPVLGTFLGSNLKLNSFFKTELGGLKDPKRLLRAIKGFNNKLSLFFSDDLEGFIQFTLDELYRQVLRENFSGSHVNFADNSQAALEVQNLPEKDITLSPRLRAYVAQVALGFQKGLDTLETYLEQTATEAGKLSLDYKLSTLNKPSQGGETPFMFQTLDIFNMIKDKVSPFADEENLLDLVKKANRRHLGYTEQERADEFRALGKDVKTTINKFGFFTPKGVKGTGVIEPLNKRSDPAEGV